MIKAVLFDLDGTLLPMNLDEFTQVYFKTLTDYMKDYGYDKQELINCIWQGTKAMLINDGSATNEETFWKVFKEILNKPIDVAEKQFAEYYKKYYIATKDVCGVNPQAKEVVEFIKSLHLPVILATNPVFPIIATKQRLEWTGLKVEDFALVTTYENSSYCKPSKEYYKDILNTFGLEPQDCLMVGNDVSDDMSAKDLGMNVFLLTDCLINKKGVDISIYPNGGFDKLKEYVICLNNK